MAFWLATGALCCALSVVGGAFGAHGLESRLDAVSLARWETAAKYLMYGGFGQMAIGLTRLAAEARGLTPSGLSLAGTSLLAGTLVFSLTVATIALGGPRWLGAITPLGGLGMIVGFVALAIVAFRM